MLLCGVKESWGVRLVCVCEIGHSHTDAGFLRGEKSKRHAVVADRDNKAASKPSEVPGCTA